MVSFGADDVVIVAKRNFSSILKERIDDALRIIQNWLGTKVWRLIRPINPPWSWSSSESTNLKP